MLEYEDKFVLTSIKGALPGVVLHPYAHVLELVECLRARNEQFADMPPVHKREMDRAIGGVSGAKTEGFV